MPEATSAPTQGRTEAPADDLDAIYHQEAHRRCEAHGEVPTACPNRATWLALCWCSNCALYEGALCDDHRVMLLDCEATDSPIRHRIDDGLMRLRRLRRL